MLSSQKFARRHMAMKKKKSIRGNKKGHVFETSKKKDHE